MKTVVQEQLTRLVEAIVAEVSPLRIVLFGSAARGEMTGSSDLDLLVVMPDGSPRRETAKLLYGRIRGVRVPFDIVVATPCDLEKHGSSPGLIYREILREGRELYARMSRAVPLAGSTTHGEISSSPS